MNTEELEKRIRDNAFGEDVIDPFLSALKFYRFIFGCSFLSNQYRILAYLCAEDKVCEKNEMCERINIDPDGFSSFCAPARGRLEIERVRNNHYIATPEGKRAYQKLKDDIMSKIDPLPSSEKKDLYRCLYAINTYLGKDTGKDKIYLSDLILITDQKMKDFGIMLFGKDYTADQIESYLSLERNNGLTTERMGEYVKGFSERINQSRASSELKMGNVTRVKVNREKRYMVTDAGHDVLMSAIEKSNECLNELLQKRKKKELSPDYCINTSAGKIFIEKIVKPASLGDRLAGVNRSNNETAVLSHFISCLTALGGIGDQLYLL